VFPLVGPANVPVDTADTTPTPANYTIVFDSSTATSGLQLGDGSVLEGYTVQAASGNVAASAISCSAGSVTIRRLVVAGAASGASATKPARGIAIGTGNADTCTGALSNLTVRNFQVGVAVTTASPTALTITDTTLRDNGSGTAGAGLLIAEGKVTATRLTVNKSTTGIAGWGVALDPTSAITAPSLTATDLIVDETGRTGLELRLPAAMAAPTATLTGGDIDPGGLDPAVHVFGGTLSLTGTNVHGAGSDGLRVEAGTVTIGAGSKLDGNARDGLRLVGGAVTLGALTGTMVSVAGNIENGIKVDALSATPSLAITRAQITGSGKTGLEVDVVNPGGQITVSDSDLSGNLDGVVVIRAPASSGDAVSLSNVRVFNNGRTGPGGVGVALRADTGSVVAAVKNCAIHDNRDQGLLIRQGASFVTTATIEGNDIYANNTAAGRSVGGILFATSSTLASFTGNKLHGNAGDEIGFDAQPNGGDTWNLAGLVACTTPNQIYCYTAPGGTSVGLRILDTAPMGTKVNAPNISWSNLVPTKGTDFEFDMTRFDVTALPACAAVVATCN
jgi:hypothetical protein